MPGILLITIAGTASGAAITVAMDMTEGITARFRTMAISRASVLAGHVLGNTIQAIIAVALVLGVGLLVGFRPTAGPLEWLAAAGLIVLISFALSWIGVAMGMQSKTVETASNLPLILTVLPLLGSGFVPTASMPGWLQVVRPVPAVHAVHRGDPRAAARHPARLEPVARDRVGDRDRDRRVRLVDGDLRAQVGALTSLEKRPGRTPIPTLGLGVRPRRSCARVPSYPR